MDLLGGLMILVTLGTQDKPFDRLLKVIEKEIEKGKIKEKVIVQAGYTPYKSDKMEILDFVSMDAFEKLMDKCDLLITHGGVGSILAGLTHHKKVIAAARLKQYGEHTNDHQKQIIGKFVKDKYIVELKDFSKLGEAIQKAKKLKEKQYQSNTENMVKLIENYIDKH